MKHTICMCFLNLKHICSWLGNISEHSFTKLIHKSQIWPSMSFCMQVSSLSGESALFFYAALIMFLWPPITVPSPFQIRACLTARCLPRAAQGGKAGGGMQPGMGDWHWCLVISTPLSLLLLLSGLASVSRGNQRQRLRWWVCRPEGWISCLL